MNEFKISIHYYFDQTQSVSENMGFYQEGLRCVSDNNTTYPVYVLWPDNVSQDNLVTTETITHSNLTDLLDISSETKKRNIKEWKRRLNELAVMYDNTDNSLKWAHQNSNDINIFNLPAINTTESKRLDNTSKHRPKGIGIAWRCVCKYENPSYTTYNTSNLIRSDRYDHTTSLGININNGDNIEILIKQIEEEYQLQSETDSHVREWYYKAGSSSNLDLWSNDSHYGGRIWYFTSYDNNSEWQPLYSLYASTDINDWNNLWDEYVNALCFHYT